MVGLLKWEKLGRFKVGSEKIYIKKLPLLRVSLEEHGKLLPLRLRKAKSLFSEQKIHRVITPTHFPYWENLSPLRPYDPLPVLQSLGGELLLAQLKKRRIDPQKTTVALVGKTVTESLGTVAHNIAPFVEHIIIDTQEGGDFLREELFYRFGLAPCYGREKATVCLYFSPSSGSNRRISLALYRVDSSDFSGIKLKNTEFPNDFQTPLMTALLLQAEKVQKKDIDFT